MIYSNIQVAVCKSGPGSSQLHAMLKNIRAGEQVTVE
jgi:hypothetical protein